MEPLLAQLKAFPGRLAALPTGIKAALAIAVVLGLSLVGVTRVVVAERRTDYVFTSLSASDSAACADALTAASIPFTVDANGAAISVPHDRVHEARLLLAGQGLPRGAGIGFEIFDKGDLGVSEFTQRVNLQRAVEGELSRTIQTLGPVREARVHLTLPKKGLFRDEDKSGQGAVMVRMHPGRTLDEGAIAGIRHLVAAAVPGLAPQSVTILDDAGNLLGETSATNGLLSAQKKLERSLEERVLAVLEPSVGKESVVARVTAELDDADEGAVVSVFDPDRTVLRSERTRNDERQDRNGLPATVAGAAANAVTEEPGAVVPAERQSQATRAEFTRTWEVTNTVTKRTSRSPRLKRLSIAIVVAEGATPRSASEVTRLAELARRAVGFDEDRGDLLEISSLPFVRPKDIAADVADDKIVTTTTEQYLVPGMALLGLLVVGGVAAVVLRGRQKKKALAAAAALEAEQAKRLQLAAGDTARRGELALTDGARPATTDGVVVSLSSPAELPPATPQTHAMALALANPQRAAMVLEAWIDEDDVSQMVLPSAKPEEHHV